MAASRVRADYSSLAEIARAFGSAASDTRQMLKQLKQQKDVLQNKNWSGKGSARFYAEMDATVLPAVTRLASALEAAQRTTARISIVMQQAENDAARVLNGDSAGDEDRDKGGVAAIVGGMVGAAVGGVVGGPLGAVAGAAVGAAVGDAIGDAMGGPATPASDARAAAVQKFIDAGDKQGAIDEAIKQYGVDTSAVNGKVAYDSSTSGEGNTKEDGSVTIGDAAFSSPGWLASSIGHEALHAGQLKDGRWDTTPPDAAFARQNAAMNEVEAYDWEIKNAAHHGLSEADVKTVQRRRERHYNKLSDENKKRVDSGNYFNI